MKSLIEFFKKKLFHRDRKFFEGILDGKTLSLPRKQVCYTHKGPKIYLACDMGSTLVYKIPPAERETLYQRWRLDSPARWTSRYIFVVDEWSYTEVRSLLDKNGYEHHDLHYRY